MTILRLRLLSKFLYLCVLLCDFLLRRVQLLDEHRLFRCVFFPVGDVIASYCALFALRNFRDVFLRFFQRVYESCDVILLPDDDHGLIMHLLLHLESLFESCFHPSSLRRIVVLCENFLDIKLFVGVATAVVGFFGNTILVFARFFALDELVNAISQQRWLELGTRAVR